MQYAISDRIGVFSLALPPWVIAIASAGSVASDGSGEVDDMEGRPALRIPESGKARLLQIF
jgi:hypothetical protein